MIAGGLQVCGLAICNWQSISELRNHCPQASAGDVGYKIS